MPNRLEEFRALVEAGKRKEALAMLEEEKVRAKYSPDTITSVDGKPPKFTKRGKPVEQGKDGIWRLKLQAGKLVHTLKLLQEDADISEVFGLPAGTLTISASEGDPCASCRCFPLPAIQQTMRLAYIPQGDWHCDARHSRSSAASCHALALRPTSRESISDWAKDTP
jgi:hypothetical protein